MAHSITSTAPSDIALVRQRVHDMLIRYCRSEALRAGMVHPNYGRLWQAITDYQEAGGKRLRPYLVVAAYEAFGGTDDKAIIQVAGAWELIHGAMLMHDDIIDRDYIRHGKPNVSGIYLDHYAAISDEQDRRHYADSSAILAGDLMISASYRMLSSSTFAPERIGRVSELLYDAIFSTAGGELLDVEASTTLVDIAPQLIAEAKTANYSLVGPLLSGALLAGADHGTLSGLRKLGMVLGVGFQYVDDVLGLFGDEATTGKPAKSDLEEGKRTFMVVEALQLMSLQKRARTETLLRLPSTDSVAELESLIRATGIEAVAKNRIAGFRDEALDLIDQLGLSRDHQAVFERIVTTLLDRKS